MDMMFVWVAKNIKPITDKILKNELLNLFGKEMENKASRDETIDKTFTQLESMMFPVLEHKIFGGVNRKQFLCGPEMTPVDYMLSCELNTILMLLRRQIDKVKFPCLNLWNKQLNSCTELEHTREQY
jgi:hypothetical protein